MRDLPSPDEPRFGARTASISAALLLITGAFTLSKTGRDALYFQADGLFDLPKAYVGIAVLSLPMALLMLGLMRWLGTRWARVATALVTAVGLVAIAGVAKPGGGTLMTLTFMLIPLVFGVLFSSSWLLAADLLEQATRPQLARAYGVIAAASILGGALGALLAKMLAMRVEPQALFLLGAAALVLAAALMGTAHRICPRRSMFHAGMPVLPTKSDIRLVIGERYTRLLFAIAMLASLAGILIEFQFYLVAATSGNSGRTNASFFAGFYLALSGAALIIQILLLPPMQRRFGIYGSLFILPGALCGGVAALLATASGFTQSLLRVAEGSLKSSIHRVSWEQAYLPLSGAQRAVAKIFADGFGLHAAEAIAAGIVVLWLRFTVGDGGLVGRSTSWVGWLPFGVVLLWIALTRALGRNLSGIVRTREIALIARADIPVADT
jgi:ATP/ADP translocase